MDATDTLAVRIVVLVMSALASAVWVAIAVRAMSIRGNIHGRLLRSRALMVLSFVINVVIMSVILLFLDIPPLEIVWRGITRIQASLVALIVGIDVLTMEGRNKHG